MISLQKECTVCRKITFDKGNPEKNNPTKIQNNSRWQGTVAIFDTGLWHRAGCLVTNFRDEYFVYYGPWFRKPYYDFPNMFKREQLSKHLKVNTFNPYSPKNIRENTLLKRFNK